jgi:hypothetical protein
MMRDYDTGGTVEAVESKYSASMDSNLRPSQLLARITCGRKSRLRLLLLSLNLQTFTKGRKEEKKKEEKTRKG